MVTKKKSPGAALKKGLEAVKAIAEMEAARPAPLAAFISDPHVGNHARYGGPTVDGLNRRGRETLEVLRRAVALAVNRGAKSLVVCGDLNQTARPEPAVLRAEQDIFAAAREHLRVILIPGNHDMPDTSCEAGNTAMAPLWEVAHVVRGPERWPLGADTGLLCVPFDGRTPMTEYLTEVLSDPKCTKGARVLATHVGVWDKLTAAPWMRKARDGIDAGVLFDLMEKAGIATAFVGNYHNYRAWMDVEGAPNGQTPLRSIVQVGTLCPASHGDGGLVDRGLVAFLEEDGTWSKQEVPGPRFITLSPLENGNWPFVDRSENGWSYYVRTKGGVIDGGAELHGWNALENDAPKEIEGDFELRAPEETDEEAIVATVAEIDLSPLVSRDAVRDLALACWGKA